jgi:hypothetical protein
MFFNADFFMYAEGQCIPHMQYADFSYFLNEKYNKNTYL